MTNLKIMTWNVENLFQPSTLSDQTEKSQYEQKLQSLADVILQLDSDIIALQEIGSPNAIDDLNNLLANRYPFIKISENPDTRGIRVGYLSKLKIHEHDEVVDFPADGLPRIPGIDSEGDFIEITQMSRGALRILVEPFNGFRLNLVNTHLKSKLLSFPSSTGRPRFNPKNEDERARIAGLALLKRTAEAVALRVKVNEILENNKDQALILLGDLNDVTNAATTEILNGPGGSQIGTQGFNQPDKGDDTRLFNLAPLIPEDRRFSRINQGAKELIDHILVSVELLPGNPRQKPVVDSHIDIFGGLPSIGPVPSVRQGQPASDHAPITAIFTL